MQRQTLEVLLFGIRSRFLFFLLIAAALPLFSAVLITLHYASVAKTNFEHRLDRTKRALTAQIDSEGARREELLLKLERLPSISTPIHEAAEARRAAPATAATQVHDAVAELFQREAPSLMAVATAQGAQVVLGNADPVAVDVKDLPTASTALTGQSVQMFAKYQDTLYRFSAMPIGVAEGALIIGDKIGESSAIRWREAVQADVSLIVGNKVVVSTTTGDLRNALVKLADNTATTVSTGHSGLGWTRLGLLDRFFPIGVAHPAEGSIGAPVPGAVAVVTVPTEISWMGGVQALGFVGSLIILITGLVWMQVIYGPVYRQARSIEAHLARLKVERNAKLTTKGFSTPFSAVVDHLDKLVDFWGIREAQLAAQVAMAKDASAAPTPVVSEAPRPVIARPQVALPLATTASTEEAESIDQAFPFGEGNSVKTQKQKAAEATQADLTPTATPQAPKPVPAPKLSATPAPSTGGRTTPAPKPTPGPKPVAAVARPTSSDAVVPLPGAQRAPQRAPVGPSITDDDLPPELLARSQELEEELLAPAEDPEEEHFRAVFDEFVTVRRRCGEPADGLTLDKFKGRLQKNRDQLIEKFGCKTVRFQVYVKDGKAAVKALPVH